MTDNLKHRTPEVKPVTSSPLSVLPERMLRACLQDSDYQTPEQNAEDRAIAQTWLSMTKQR